MLLHIREAEEVRRVGLGGERRRRVRALLRARREEARQAPPPRALARLPDARRDQHTDTGRACAGGGADRDDDAPPGRARARAARHPRPRRQARPARAVTLHQHNLVYKYHV